MADEVPAPPSPPPPPAAPDGWETGPPDFVGVGAMKSGTTWWWSILADHPDVVADGSRTLDGTRTTKELHFFDRYGQVADIDPRAYHRHFPRPAGATAGEWTPRYMYDFWTPPMLRAAAPEVRLLVMLRDPVERYISGLRHIAGRGFPVNTAVRHQHFERGLYWQQLIHLLRYFDRRNVLVVQYERCVADLAGQAERTFRFLGLDPGRWSGVERASRHVGPRWPDDARAELNPATRDALTGAYAAGTARLLAEFPELDGELWPSAK